MGHLFPYDEAWDQMKTVVFDLIHMFIHNASSPKGARASLRPAEFVTLLDHELRILPYLSDTTDGEVFRKAKRILKEKKRRSSLTEKVLGRSLVADIVKRRRGEEKLNAEFREYAQSLLDHLNLSIQTQVCHPGMYRRIRRDLLLGAYLIPNNSQLQDSWDRSLTRKGRRIGKLLVEGDVIPQELLERALGAQSRELNRIRKRMAEDFWEYLKQKKI
jgi:hypothetical protein